MATITLTLPDDLMQQAEAYAQAHGKELDELLKDYLQQLLPDPLNAAEISPAILKLMGSVQLPPGMTYEQVKDEYLTNKYLR